MEAGTRNQPPPQFEAFHEFELAGWINKALGYSAFFSEISGKAIAAILDAAVVVSGKSVLEVGCGGGEMAAAAKARGARVIGTDVTPQMLEIARRTHPGVEFVLADAEELPFHDGQFEAVVGNLLVPHLARPEKAVASMARVLKKGGRLVLSTWDTPEKSRLMGLVADAVARVGAAPPVSAPPGPPTFQFSDESAFGKLLESAGLREIKVRTLSFTQAIAGVDALWEGLMRGTVRTAHLVQCQPFAVQHKIRAVFDELAAPYAGEDGHLDLPISVKIAVGVKTA